MLGTEDNDLEGDHVVQQPSHIAAGSKNGLVRPEPSHVQPARRLCRITWCGTDGRETDGRFRRCCWARKPSNTGNPFKRRPAVDSPAIEAGSTDSRREIIYACVTLGLYGFPVQTPPDDPGISGNPKPFLSWDCYRISQA